MKTFAKVKTLMGDGGGEPVRYASATLYITCMSTLFKYVCYIRFIWNIFIVQLYLLV